MEEEKGNEKIALISALEEFLRKALIINDGLMAKMKAFDESILAALFKNLPVDEHMLRKELERGRRSEQEFLQERELFNYKFNEALNALKKNNSEPMIKLFRLVEKAVTEIEFAIVNPILDGEGDIDDADESSDQESTKTLFSTLGFRQAVITGWGQILKNFGILEGVSKEN